MREQGGRGRFKVEGLRGGKATEERRQACHRIHLGFVLSCFSKYTYQIVDIEPAPISGHTADTPESHEKGKRRLNILGFSCLGGCILILFLPLLLLLGSYSIERYKCSRFQPTGDKLLDTYAKEVIHREAPRLFASSYQVFTSDDPYVEPKRPLPGYLEHEVFEGWEDNFGDDPRFWQLRYLRTWGDSLPEEFRDEYGDKYDRLKVGFVDEAIEHNAVDADLLWLKWASVRSKWVDTIEEEMQAELAEGLDAKVLEVETPDFKLDNLEVERRVIAKYGEEMFGLLDQMIDSSPEVSFPYYRRGIANYCAGKMDAAMADFEAGNAAPRNEMPLCFPQQPMVDNGDIAELAGNDVLYGVLMESTMMNPRQNYIVWREVAKEISEQAIINGDTQLLQEFHMFLCRTGMAKNVDTILQAVSLKCIRYLLEPWLVGEGGNLSPEKRQALLKLDRRIGRMMPRGMSSEFSDTQNWDKQSVVGNLVVKTGNYSPHLRRLVGKDMAGDYGDPEDLFKPGFERMARFSFHDLSWQEE